MIFEEGFSTTADGVDETQLIVKGLKQNDRFEGGRDLKGEGERRRAAAAAEAMANRARQN